MPTPICWIITEGAQGMVNNCLALAEAVGATIVDKRVRLRTPWRQLSPYLRLGARFAVSPEGDPIAPPWPDLAIACGRQSILPALAIRRASCGRTVTVYVQDPVIDPRHFDLVVAPQHDRRKGRLDAPNVILTRGAPNRVTPERLAEGVRRHGPRLEALPHPRLAVLIGGANAVFTFGPDRMRDIAAKLADLARSGVGLMITASRRTGAENEAILREALAGLPVEIWDGTGDNPYFAYLALADAVAVTADSVNMVSEAATTGKPVHVIALDGGSPKFDAFHAALRAEGVTRPFDGTLPTWHYEPLDATTQAAAEIRRRLAERRRA